MAGGELRAPRCPVDPHGHELFAQDHVVMLAPGDASASGPPAGHPARPWPHRAERGGASAAGPAPADAGGHEGGGLDLGWQAHPEGTAHAHDVGDLPVVEALEKGGIVAVAGVRDHRGKRDAPRPRLIHQGERQCGLCLKRDVGRDPHLGCGGHYRWPRLRGDRGVPSGANARGRCWSAHPPRSAR